MIIKHLHPQGEASCLELSQTLSDLMLGEDCRGRS